MTRHPAQDYIDQGKAERAADDEIKSSVGSFTVEHDDDRWGPFETANEAAEWAINNLPGIGRWIIRPLLDPAGER